MVRCKFRVLSVTEHFSHFESPDGKLDSKVVTSTEVRLVPVQHKGSDENRSFWQATPSGELRMTITNPAAAMRFEVGRTYYLDFTPAEGGAYHLDLAPVSG